MRITKLFWVSASVAASLSAAILPASAATSVVSVAGANNPFLAGAPPGTVCCGGDTAPTNSPSLFTGFAAGSSMTFAALGTTNGAGYGDIGAEGTSNFDMTDYTTGIAPALGVGVNALLGVFLSDAAPTPATQPASLDFNGNRSFASLAPAIGQIFYIGDGLTGAGTGAAQSFTAPTSATRLFLGVADGFGWYNNGGTLSVTVDYTPAAAGAVPEPASWAMLLIGCGAVGATLRTARKPVLA